MTLLVDSARACKLYYTNVVQNEAAGILVRSKLFAIAQRLGFSEVKRENMALVSAELISNQIKYAKGRGLIQIWEQPGPVLDIFALDYGPGIGDLHLAQQDGYSSAHTLGKGLGSTQRLADAVHLYTRPEQPEGRQRKWNGTAVLARFHLNKPAPDQPFELGLYARALTDERHNGDHFYVQRTGEGLRWLHLDGLGHGVEAEQATSNLGKPLLSEQGLLATLESVDRQLHGTRGAVAILGAIDLKARRLELAGVGDMQAYVALEENLQHHSFPPGVLGKEHKKILPVKQALNPASLLMSATDGIRRNWDEHSFPGLLHLHPQLIGYTLGNIMGRISDDQSLCAIRLA